LITERNGNESAFELPREKLAGPGTSAIRLLMKAGVHVVGREVAQKALVQFLRFMPRREIIRMPRVGWAEVGSHWIFARPDEVITPPGMPQAGHVTYVLDAAAIRHGLHVTGTTAEWAAEIATPLRGNSNVALSFATFFAAPLLHFASEPGGGNHLYGPSTIGKTMVSDVGQSIYGWPLETADDAFGVTWAGSEAGFDALALARTDLGLPLDEITLADRRPRTLPFSCSPLARNRRRNSLARGCRKARGSGSSIFLPKFNRAARSRRSRASKSTTPASAYLTP
jgi:hypothetical protein